MAKEWPFWKKNGTTIDEDKSQASRDMWKYMTKVIFIVLVANRCSTYMTKQVLSKCAILALTKHKRVTFEIPVCSLIHLLQEAYQPCGRNSWNIYALFTTYKVGKQYRHCHISTHRAFSAILFIVNNLKSTIVSLSATTSKYIFLSLWWEFTR